MTTIRPGSHAHRLLQLLSAAGEIPPGALPILGNGQVLSKLVRKLETVQDVRFGKDGPAYRAKLVQVSGKRGGRNIRLYRKGLPALDGLYPGLHGWYMDSFRQHSFSNDLSHIGRNHRVAEALALCMAAGVEVRPYALPPLQKAGISHVVPGSPSFYVARHIKRLGEDETSKTAYTRIVGALFCPGGIYAAYNTRNAAMKWSGRGEAKALGNLQELARYNAGPGEVRSALLFGQGADVALRTVLESDRSRRPELRFDRIYGSVHFVPLDRSGARLLKMLVSPDWSERLLAALFDGSQRSYNLGAMEYDAIVGGRAVLSHLDGDIARLIRFREALVDQARPADVICFPWQSGFLKAYLGGRARLRELEMGAVESALGI